MSNEEARSLRFSDTLPPREEWGEVRIDGSHFKDGKDISFQVPFTSTELDRIQQAKGAHKKLSEEALNASGPMREFYLQHTIPYGYSLNDRTLALGELRTTAAVSDNLLQVNNLSENSRVALQTIKASLEPFLPPPLPRK